MILQIGEIAQLLKNRRNNNLGELPAEYMKRGLQIDCVLFKTGRLKCGLGLENPADLFDWNSLRVQTFSLNLDVVSSHD